MNKFLLFTAVLILLGADPAPATASPAALKGWERSVVLLEVNRKQYDYQQPWAKRSVTAQKTAIVVGPREALTTADELADHTLLRLQKDGRGKWWKASVTWIDYHANLALVTAEDPAFWGDLKPVELAEAAPGKEQMEIVRWRNGNMERRKAEFTQFMVDDGRLSFVSHLQLELSSEISGVGRAEPVIVGKKIFGLLSAQNGNNCRAIPAAFIRPILEARKKGGYHGLAYFPFVWQPTENPSTHKFLKWNGDPRGVVIIDSPATPGEPPLLKPRDIILKVDGFDIDTQGYYQDPEYGHLILENLSTRRKFAGDAVRMKVWRDGAAVEVNYPLPKAEYSTKLLPDQSFDQEPEFLIAGGLLFQPLSGAYLRSWGQDWKRSAPFRLTYYNNDAPTKDRPALIILSAVFPDAYNLGYQDSRALVVDRVNGQKVSRLPDLQLALKKPVDGFHIIEFARGDSLRKIVLEAGNLEAATRRVLQRFGIPLDHVFGAQPKAPAPAATASR